MTRATLTASLALLAADLGVDDLRVLVEIADRLRMGAKVYGALDIAADPRDWRRDAAEEALDMAVYSAAELLRLGPSPRVVALRLARARAKRDAFRREAEARRNGR